MPRMQVTFNNLTQSPAKMGVVENLSTLTFQIDFRGKRYDCVGHVLRSENFEGTGRSRIIFSGYYGYNGPINIQELRRAVIDYCQSVTGETEKQLTQADSGREFMKRLHAQLQTEKSAITNKSYEFNVGNYQQPGLKEAS